MLHCQTPLVGPFPKSNFSPRDRDPPALLFWFVTRHLIRISRRSRREAESEKNLCSGEKILPSRISNPYLKLFPALKTSGKFEIQTQYLSPTDLYCLPIRILVSASPIRSGYPNQGCVTFFFYRFMRSDAGDHWRTHRPGRVYKRTITPRRLVRTTRYPHDASAHFYSRTHASPTTEKLANGFQKKPKDNTFAAADTH